MFEFFDLLINDKIIDTIIKHTKSRFVLTAKEKSEKLKKPLTSIKPITYDEIEAFFGLLLLFGVTKKGDIDISEIWCPTSVHYLHLGAATMPRLRFQQISSMICFYDKDYWYF